MALMMSSLMAYSDLVPPSAREAIKAAHAAPAGSRELRKAAARELYEAGNVSCQDALELVDLGDESAECGCT